jgi:hypothetical protein
MLKVFWIPATKGMTFVVWLNKNINPKKNTPSKLIEGVLIGL